MVHLTLNFGKYNHNPKSLLNPKVDAIARSFLDKGGGSFPPPYDAYRVEMATSATGLAFYFFKHDAQISAGMGTWSAAAAREFWKELEGDFRKLFAVGPQLFTVKQPPKMPDSLPWLATLLLPDFFTQVKSDSADVEFLNTCEVVLFLAAHKRALSK
jgi:hypothetical protein